MKRIFNFQFFSRSEIWLRQTNFRIRFVHVLLFLILILAAFMRLYKIGDYMTFLGDEGRDVLIARDIILGAGDVLHGNLAAATGKFTLLGPRASAGDFFTGPIYYYMIAPFLWLFGFDPVGPAVMIGILGVITVFFVYYFGKVFFSERAGLIAAALYAVSPLVISYSRSSWNPNPMPFFSLIILLLLYTSVLKKSLKLFLISGILFGIAFQLHYIEVFMAIIIIMCIALGSFLIDKKQLLIRLLKQYLMFGCGFIIGFSPFLFFEIRHGFPNTRTIFNFIFHTNFGGQETMVDKATFLQIIWDVFFRLFGRLLTRFPSPEQVNVSEHIDLFAWKWATILLAVASIYILFKQKDKIKKTFILLWLVFGILLFGFYKKPIYDYYFEFMFPVPFLLVGNLLSHMIENKKIKLYGTIAAVIIFLVLFVVNLYGMPFRFSPNQQKNQVKMISDFILQKAEKKPFNFALLTKGNSDHAYRYFFAIEGNSPVTIENTALDPQRKSVTKQLFIVCEDPECQPLGNSLWEVAGFGRATISAEWDVSVVKIYKLNHYKEQ